MMGQQWNQWSHKYPFSPTLKVRIGIMAQEKHLFGKFPTLPAQSPYVYFDEALKIDPISTETLIEYGYLLDIDERYKEAEYCFETVIALEPNTDAYIGLANIFYQTNRREEALDLLQEALDRNKNSINKIDALISKITNNE